MDEPKVGERSACRTTTCQKAIKWDARYGVWRHVETGSPRCFPQYMSSVTAKPKGSHQ